MKLRCFYLSTADALILLGLFGSVILVFGAGLFAIGKFIYKRFKK